MSSARRLLCNNAPFAEVVIYEAFVEGRLEAPKHLARTVHDLYFEPKYDEFRGWGHLQDVSAAGPENPDFLI